MEVVVAECGAPAHLHRAMLTPLARAPGWVSRYGDRWPHSQQRVWRPNPLLVGKEDPARVLHVQPVHASVSLFLQRKDLLPAAMHGEDGCEIWRDQGKM